MDNPHNQKNESFDIEEFDNTQELPNIEAIRNERNPVLILFIIIIILFFLAIAFVLFFPGVLQSLTGG